VTEGVEDAFGRPRDLHVTVVSYSPSDEDGVSAGEIWLAREELRLLLLGSAGLALDPAQRAVLRPGYVALQAVWRPDVTFFSLGSGCWREYRVAVVGGPLDEAVRAQERQAGLTSEQLRLLLLGSAGFALDPAESEVLRSGRVALAGLLLDPPGPAELPVRARISARDRWGRLGVGLRLGPCSWWMEVFRGGSRILSEVAVSAFPRADPEFSVEFDWRDLIELSRASADETVDVFLTLLLSGRAWSAGGVVSLARVEEVASAIRVHLAADVLRRAPRVDVMT
jgi:hypothetical protein